MPQIPYEMVRMGPELRKEVERQLLADLQNYGVQQIDLSIDWSDACQEGHCTTCFSGELESLSGVNVVDQKGTIVAEGWMDFVHGGTDRPLFVFWLFLAVNDGDTRREVKTDPVIPEHIWQRLLAETRSLCGASKQYDATWARNPKVVAWKKSHAS